MNMLLKLMQKWNIGSSLAQCHVNCFQSRFMSLLIECIAYAYPPALNQHRTLRFVIALRNFTSGCWIHVMRWGCWWINMAGWSTDIRRWFHSVANGFEWHDRYNSIIIIIIIKLSFIARLNKNNLAQKRVTEKWVIPDWITSRFCSIKSFRRNELCGVFVK